MVRRLYPYRVSHSFPILERVGVLTLISPCPRRKNISERSPITAALKNFCLACVGCLLLCLAALPASARQLTINNFHAEVEVHPDAIMDVTETIEAHFSGEWHGLYRTIPVEYRTPQGLNYTLFLKVLSVADDNGTPLKYEVSTENGYKKFKIYVPDAVNATRTVVLHYSVRDGLRFFDDHDELYWNLTGDEWDVPIQHATGHIILPEGVTGVRTLAFTGARGSRDADADVTSTGNEVQVVMRRGLMFHEGLTLVVGWDKGFVRPPSASEKVWQLIESNWPFAIPLLVFLTMFYVWWTRGRDPQRQAIAVQYEPPDKLTPGECGTLVDNEAAMRDITATLVDLAVKGYITIEEKDESHMMGLSHTKNYLFHLKKPAAEWTGARPHEVEMLNALFDCGNIDVVSLTQLQNHFYAHLPAIRDRIFDALVLDNYYLHRPDRVRQTYMGIAVVTAVTLGVCAGIIANSSGMSPAPWIISAIVSGAVIFAFSWVMPARTITGARTLEKVLGFEDFLEHVESDRFARVIKTPEMFEKFLPYAMALRVESKWVQAFAKIVTTPPNWYQGGYPGAYNALFLVNSLNMMSSHASSAMSSAPRSSGGSGFGGGGGAGGGFGGGGGGGF
jgi:uncharacterized membrane protein